MAPSRKPSHAFTALTESGTRAWRVVSSGWRVAGEGRLLNADCENCIFALTAFTLRRKALAANWLKREGALHASLHAPSRPSRHRAPCAVGNAVRGVPRSAERVELPKIDAS